MKWTLCCMRHENRLIPSWILLVKSAIAQVTPQKTENHHNPSLKKRGGGGGGVNLSTLNLDWLLMIGTVCLPKWTQWTWRLPYSTLQHLFPKVVYKCCFFSLSRTNFSKRVIYNGHVKNVSTVVDVMRKRVKFSFRCGNPWILILC